VLRISTPKLLEEDSTGYGFFKKNEVAKETYLAC